MGETVNGRSSEVAEIFLTESLMNLEHFDTNLMGSADCGYLIVTKNRPKMDCMGYGIKSNKYL